MIEVEKKFQPTYEQLKVMLEGAEFLGEVLNHDIYYDYSDYRLLKKDIRLRSRNSSFELKIGKSSGVAEEIENIQEIERYFDVVNLQNFIHKNLVAIIDYKTKRQKYKKGEFNIDVDEMSFGQKMCEIELLVEHPEQIKEAEQKIIDFAGKYGIKAVKGLTKRNEYFRLVKPEVYKELFETKKSMNLEKLEDIPNIGKAIAEDLRGIGIKMPEDLKNKDGFALYRKLCKQTRVRHDPCVLDTFIAAVDYMNGAPKRPWWYYTKQRKEKYPNI